MIQDLRTKESILKNEFNKKCDRVELAEEKLQTMEMMKSELDTCKFKIKLLETRNEELMDRNEKLVKPNIAGLHISNLVSDSWHENNKWAARGYFAFPGWRIAKAVVDAVVVPRTYLFPEITAQGKQGETDSIRKSKLIRCNVLQEVLIALLKMRKNYTIQELVTITGYSKKGLSSLLNRYIPLLGDVGRLLSSFRLEKKLITSNQVIGFKKSALSNFAVIGDGKDIMSYAIRCHSSLRPAQLSNKEKRACNRGLSFSLSNGLYCITSPPFLARATKQKIFRLITSKALRLTFPGTFKSRLVHHCNNSSDGIIYIGVVVKSLSLPQKRNSSGLYFFSLASSKKTFCGSDIFIAVETAL
mmetsp:Transcript_13494/g.17500  ORF Transcript_13494/g.17500 Transcript_13494/m.17500 type:complete len:358 (-) Transcript_13494:1366-2439(-)